MQGAAYELRPRGGFPSRRSRGPVFPIGACPSVAVLASNASSAMKRRRQKRPSRIRATEPGSESATLDGPLALPSVKQYRVREGRVIEVDDVTSARLRTVRQHGTRPELLVRRSLSELGHRYRLRNRDLPGSPDIANRAQRWAVFVHGCFWHRHGCRASTTPSRNREFWEAKFARNVARDQRVVDALRGLGYAVIIIWECETKRGAATVRAELLRQLAGTLPCRASTPSNSRTPGAPTSSG
jgi:DNA mismatch endonuclease (patch repair protein)